MAGTFAGGDDEPISAINVTPLVDVVLVLLVIFLITAPVIYQSAIKVQLPTAKSGEQNQKSPLNFSLTRDGTLAMNEQPADWNALPAQLEQMVRANPEQTASISADKDTPHGVVIRLMDLLRQSGIYRFAMNVESK